MGVATSTATKDIANGIAECCASLGVAPVDLSLANFKNWLKAEMDLDASELRAISDHLTKVGGFVALRNAFFASAPTGNTMEKLEMKGLAKVSAKATQVVADQGLFLRQFETMFSRVLATQGKLKPFGYSVKESKEREERVVNLLLSDLHFGSWLDPREVPYKYGFQEESRRLASVILRTCEFKSDYRDITSLHVWVGGDVVKGLIHDPQSGLALAEQQADAAHLLSQALIVLAGHFPKVTVNCSSGNHDRNVTRHHDRATAGKWDSYATTIYIALKLAVNHLPNITVNIPRTPFIDQTIFGRRLYLTHGDTNLNPGNPGRSIDVGKLEAQMNRINIGEVERGLKPYGAFCVGHVHIGSQSQPAPGILITNGCLVPPDPYSVSLNYTTTRTGQTLFESTPHRLVGDYRFLEVDKSTDKDKSLDKVISPWSGDF